nr:cellulase family glycosylhydrolase [Xylanibacillus composti]
MCIAFIMALTVSIQVLPASTSEAAPKDLVSQNGQLQVVNGQLRNAAGQPFQLVGISSHGLQWFGQYVNEDSMRWLRDDWGINVFRAAMYTAEGGYITNPSVKEKVKEAVEAAIALDLYIVIDWHILQDNNPNQYKEQAKAFFAEMSALYGQYPNVIYEIANEPNGNVTWNNDIKPYAEEVIPVIRANDPDGIVIVGTGTWSQDVHHAADNQLSFSNVMYAAHFYAGTHGQFLRDRIDYALNKGAGIFVSEWGTSDATGGGGVYLTQSQQWIDFMNSRNISWINWSLADKNESSAALRPGASPTGGWTNAQLSTSGQFVREQIRNTLGVGGGGPVIPPAPTGLTASAGNGQVTLSWSGSVGASGYNVKRSTSSGGGYATIASNVNGTSFTDQNVTNGTTYYYVVSAVNSSGQSGNSAQVSATPQANNNGGGTSGDLVVQYRVGDTSATDNQMKPQLNIKNNGNSSVNLSNLKIRYYFTNDSGKTINSFCDWAEVGCSNISVNFVQISGNQYYAEIGFTSGAGSLSAGAQSGQMQLRFHYTDWSNFNESNDYSYGGNQSSWADWDRVTLYQNGSLVWGTTP